jgi:hypothetical protein
VKIGWGTGEIVMILLSFIFYLTLGLKIDPKYSLSFFLLLSGLWTLAAGLFIVEKRDRTYYSSWGVVVAFLSAFAFLPANYAAALVLAAIVILILLTAFGYRSGKMYTATSQGSPSAPGGTPAAA